MESLWIVRVAIAVILISIPIPYSTAEPVLTSFQTDGVTVGSNVVFIVQGENSAIPGNETNHDFYALKIISFSLPWDSSRVHTNVPVGARQISAWTISGSLNSSNYGLETSGPMAGKFYIDVPASHQRNSQFVNTTANESAFLAPGNTLDQLTYSSGALQLATGFTHGTFVSVATPISSARAVTSGNLSFSGTSLDNVTGEMSNDGGISWVPCANATKVNFTSTGLSISVRFTFDANVTLGFEPKITSFKVAADYEMIVSVFTVHLSYIWTDRFQDGTAAIDLSEALPYSSSGSMLVMLYTVKGYSAKAIGFNLSFDVNGTMGTYPDKDLYYFSTTVSPPPLSSSLQLSAPKPDYSWALYGGAAGILLLVAAIYSTVRRSSRRERMHGTASVESTSPGVEEAQDMAARRKELVSRKKEILEETERTEAEISAGSLSRDVGKEKLAKLKTELKGVRNELNKIPREDASLTTGAGAKPEGGSPPVGPYEAILASLARIDEDFERGRLPEGAYRSLRKEYVSKAAAMMAEGASSGESADPRDAEKVKLMEAIVALDEERAKGEIDVKVYEELRSSYRKELAELMKRMDDSGDGG